MRKSRRKRQRQSVSPLREKHLKKEVYPILSVEDLSQAGVLVLGPQGPSVPSAFDGLRIAYGEVSLPFEQTLIWKPPMEISRVGVMQGFSRLLNVQDIHQAWEVLAMLVDLNLSAGKLGDEDERTRTLEVVGDLRLPVYDVRALWVRRTEATERTVARWAAEVKGGADERHAFLRAIYTERPMLCTLPPGWHV